MPSVSVRFFQMDKRLEESASPASGLTSASRTLQAQPRRDSDFPPFVDLGKNRTETISIGLLFWHDFSQSDKKGKNRSFDRPGPEESGSPTLQAQTRRNCDLSPFCEFG